MDIKQAFGKTASEYDQNRRKLIPCFDDFYGTAAGLIPFGRRDSFRVLDLGAGTGLLSGIVRGLYSGAEITLQDISEEMLQQARDRFKEDGHISYITGDYTLSDIPGRYDVVISALSLHHSDRQNLALVFKRIFSALEDGGIFINADQILGKTPAIEQVYMENWLSGSRAAGCTENEMEAALERRKFDKTLPLKEQLDLLESAGFSMVNCWYQYYMFAVYSGKKTKTNK